MIPAPFVSEDYLRSRLALPFTYPIVKPTNVFGINARKPFMKVELQPLPMTQAK
jgi:hypothetical protein